jgi:hypothetical protein
VGGKFEILPLEGGGKHIKVTPLMVPNRPEWMRHEIA